MVVEEDWRGTGHLLQHPLPIRSFVLPAVAGAEVQGPGPGGKKQQVAAQRHAAEDLHGRRLDALRATPEHHTRAVGSGEV